MYIFCAAGVSKYSGGCTHYFPGLHHEANYAEVVRFKNTLSRYLTRKIGFESVMRIRCSRGQSLQSFTSRHINCVEFFVIIDQCFRFRRVAAHVSRQLLRALDRLAVATQHQSRRRLCDADVHRRQHRHSVLLLPSRPPLHVEQR